MHYLKLEAVASISRQSSHYITQRVGPLDNLSRVSRLILSAVADSLVSRESSDKEELPSARLHRVSVRQNNQGVSRFIEVRMRKSKICGREVDVSKKVKLFEEI